ncbi:unnamed protein product [Adineta ricciae]|uniref:G-protein coupled receptors family 1 profile domain-containing protein n=1 Tax=Adineta ricciae TaxID=249248 RepID=A0A815ZG52_ADIRI|nr:unnamed protein product [Adineta ricciae]CAF1584365.1 unnamed protein product [Adineta ricciae]
MNQFICQENVITFDNTVAYEFSNTVSSLSIYILPILALTGNTLTLLVIFTNSHLNRSSFAVYVKCLAISDTSVLVFKFLSYQNKTSKHFYFPSFCTILIFFTEASVLLSIWTIVAITIERTFVVLLPLHQKKFVSAYRARMTILILTSIILIFSARVLIIPIDQSENVGLRCRSKTDWILYRKKNMTITEFGYCYIPLTIVIIGNLLTSCTVKRAFLRRHALIETRNFQQKRQVKCHENQLTLMLLIVTLVFIVDFVPFTIMNIIARWGLPFNLCFTGKAFEIYTVVRSLCELLKDLNFCTNFVIYCLSGRRFRYAFYSLYKCHRHQLSLNSDQKRIPTYNTVKTDLQQKSGNSSTKANVKEAEL